MGQEAIFIKGSKGMLQIIQGNVNELAASLGSELQIVDSSMSEGAGEKHLPVVEQQGAVIQVQVGSVLHPMIEEHSIQWIYLVTKKGGQIVNLQPGEEPKATFVLAPEDEAVIVYAYCNIHGLWETKLN